MTKDKIKNLLDFVPLIILTISAIVLVWTVITTETAFLWKHIVGLILLPLNYWAFWWRHKVGVLALGLTLLIGLLSLLSYSHAVTTSTWTIGKSSDSQIPVFYGQPIFLLWLLIHFIVSGRHYVAIATKKYWQDLFAKPIEITNGWQKATTGNMQFCGSGGDAKRRSSPVILFSICTGRHLSIKLLNKLLSLISPFSTRRQGRRKTIAPPTAKLWTL